MVSTTRVRTRNGLGFAVSIAACQRGGVVSKVMGGKEGGGTHVNDDTMHISIEWKCETCHEPLPLREMRSVSMYR